MKPGQAATAAQLMPAAVESWATWGSSSSSITHPAADRNSNVDDIGFTFLIITPGCLRDELGKSTMFGEAAYNASIPKATATLVDTAASELSVGKGSGWELPGPGGAAGRRFCVGAKSTAELTWPSGVTLIDNRQLDD